MSYLQDLKDQFIEAQHGTTMNPEEKGRRMFQEYSDWLDNEVKTLKEFGAPEKEIERFKETFRKYVSKILGYRQRSMNAMITGPANFPGKKNRDTMEREMQTFNDLKQVCSKVRKKFAPDRSEDPEDRLKRLEGELEKMKEANKVYKDLKKGKSLERYSEEAVSSAKKFDRLKEEGKMPGEDKPFPGYHLSSVRDKIKRTKNALEPKTATGTTRVASFGDISLIKDHDQERVQIFFPGKPSKEVRDSLKAYSFRWSPSNGAWQRKLTNAAVNAAQNLLSNLKTES